jgi:hypothetical protein
MAPIGRGVYFGSAFALVPCLIFMPPPGAIVLQLMPDLRRFFGRSCFTKSIKKIEDVNKEERGVAGIFFIWATCGVGLHNSHN